MKPPVYEPVPPYRARKRHTLPLSRRALAQNILLVLIWPFLAAVVHIVNFPQRRLLMGFVAFCAFAGLVFIPMPGSDAYAYMLRFEAFRAGFFALRGEPVPVAIMSLVAWSGFGVRWYFALVGLLYGLVVATIARLLFQDIPRNAVLSFAALVFLGAFFLNHPVFSAVNARFHLALWIFVLATMLMLDGRWKYALAVAAFGMGTHFGQTLFAVALVILLLSRWLGTWQILFAYAVLAVAVVLPPGVFVAIGDAATQIIGAGAFVDKVETHVGHAERLAAGDFVGRGMGGPWFLSWFTTPIFWSLLISSHFLFWKMRRERGDPLYQLFVLIILMWAAQFAMAGYFGGEERMQRNTTALLVLWHARFFLVRKQGAQLALLINALPLLFYFVVAYRRWFHQAGLGAFFPTIFGAWPDLWPTVMEFLGFS